MFRTKDPNAGYLRLTDLSFVSYAPADKCCTPEGILPSGCSRGLLETLLTSNVPRVNLARVFPSQPLRVFTTYVVLPSSLGNYPPKQVRL